MPTREEIREGIARTYFSHRFAGDVSFDEVSDECYAFADVDMANLHSQGVVIKVKGELPQVEITYTGWLTPSQITEIGAAYRKAYAGFGAFEPLIKEK
ncbi:hypothetical protein LCGC14_0350290 [marine sediment metagenome]|uniref:Uncharacterized protein n=1 Tax=marine sediment metagenome TaxID=412755 RepID=A0A0F9TU58_9ZZZZ